MSLPNDVIRLSVAAHISERSESWIRRKIRDGVLTRYEGETPVRGGSAPAYVSKSELMTHLAVSGQQPASTLDAPNKEATKSQVGGTLAQVSRDQAPRVGDTPVQVSDPVEVVQLRGELELAYARGEIRELKARLSSGEREREAMVSRLDLERESLTSMLDRERRTTDAAHKDASDWQERFDGVQAELTALRAELNALRSERGLPWWRRLLSGPAAAEIPEAK